MRRPVSPMPVQGVRQRFEGMHYRTDIGSKACVQCGRVAVRVPVRTAK